MKGMVLATFALYLLSTASLWAIVGLLELQIACASPYRDIDVATAYNMITNDSYPNLIVLDVRGPDEFNSGHINCAVWVPHTELEERIGELAGYENREIIVYCRTGARSAIASEILDSYNFTKVYNMLGGIQAWQASGYPVWTQEKEGTPLWMQWWFWATAAMGTVVLVGGLYFLKNRKPSTPVIPVICKGP